MHILICACHPRNEKLESTSWFVLVILVLGKFALPLLMGVSALRNCTDSSCLLLTTGITRGQNVASRKMRATLTSVKQTSPCHDRYFLWWQLSCTIFRRFLTTKRTPLIFSRTSSSPSNQVMTASRLVIYLTELRLENLEVTGWKGSVLGAHGGQSCRGVSWMLSLRVRRARLTYRPSWPCNFLLLFSSFSLHWPLRPLILATRSRFHIFRHCCQRARR